jgi:hypothetical protein
VRETVLKSKFINKSRLVISASIWRRNSHGLYDHESIDIDRYDSALVAGNLFAQSPTGELKTFELNEMPELNYNKLFKATAGSL